MTDFRRVTDDFSVSPQIGVDDLARAKAAGVTLIINNRPDGEDPAAPQGPQIEREARAAGLDYVHIPVVGAPTPQQVAAVRAAVDGAAGKVLAYCRSGTRSINTWSLGQGERDREALLKLGAEAGYDLSNVVPR